MKNLPYYAQSIIIKYRTQILLLATVLKITQVCMLFKISRTTYYKYQKRLREAIDKEHALAYLSSRPHLPKKVPYEIELKVLEAKSECPSYYGKRRVARKLFEREGIKLSPNTVQKILRKYNQPVVLVEKKEKPWWHFFEAIRPHVYWQMDVCYAYTKKKNGENVYLIAILDDHSRFIVHSQLQYSQRINDVLLVLAEAVKLYGAPECLIVDNGVQFVMPLFKEFCQKFDIKLIYCAKGHPQTKGKIERFFRTARKEHFKLNPFSTLESTREEWKKYIQEYNFKRYHSEILDENGLTQPPSFRMKNASARKVQLDPISVANELLANYTNPNYQRTVKKGYFIKYKNQNVQLPPHRVTIGQKVEIVENSKNELVVSAKGEVIATCYLL